MAQILTQQTKAEMTKGERLFYEQLMTHLNDDYLIWYNLPVQGRYRRYPDFLIFHPLYGLLCIEVKDWKMSQLKGINQQSICLEFNGEKKEKTHPLQQARSSFFSLINQMSQDPFLQQKEGKYQGRLVFPWGVGVVMSHWERNKINKNVKEKLEKCFPPQQTLYREDILKDELSTEDFIKKLHAIFPYPFGQKTTSEQIKRIRGYIFPEVVINPQQHSGIEAFFDTEKEETEIKLSRQSIKVMDIEQEKIARSLGEGHRIIHGVAGAGKTLILEFRARELARQNLDKPILVICFNKTLAARFRGRLTSHNIEIYHFHDWCKYLKEKYQISVPWSNTYVDDLPKAIYQAFKNEAIKKGQYSAVLIDEGHDLKPEWLEMLSWQPDENERLLLLYDDAQSIYDNGTKRHLGFSLSSVGIKARGRTRILKVNYRNSIEISRYAVRFFKDFVETHDYDDEDEIPLLNPECGGEELGIEPCFSYFSQADLEKKSLLSKINNWQKEGCSLGDIIILCPFKAQGKEVVHLLISEGFKVQNLTDEKQRLSFHMSEDEITVCTIHSSKGLEFPRVIIYGIGNIKDDPESLNQSARLLYVGMTRAITHLHLTASKENVFTNLLEKISH